MSDLIQIPSARESTSSGHGCSFWLPHLGCARKAHLERTLGIKASVVDEDGDRYTNKQGVKLNQTTVGILFHQILEFYHSERMQDCEFEYLDDSTKPEWDRALALFSYYRKVRPPDFFGEVLACEEFFSIGCRYEFDGTCVCEGAHKHLGAIDLLGLPYFTGRRDMRCRIHTQECADRWATFGAGEMKIGDILYVDTKTHTKRSSTFVSDKLNSIQLNSYMMVGKALGEPVIGTVANGAIWYKEMDKNEPFPLVFVPPPNADMERAIKGTFTLAYQMYQQYGSNFANPTRCFDYFKSCPFLNTHCDRTNDNLVTLSK